MAISVLTATVDSDTYGGGGANDMIVLTTSDNVPASSTLFVLVVGWQGTTPAYVTVRSAASGGGTLYTKDAEQKNPSGDHVISLHRLSNVGAGAPLSAYISAVSGGLAGTWRAAIVAVSGVKLSAPVVDADQNSDAAEDPTSATVTATASGQLALGGLYPVDYFSAVSTPSGWTLITNSESAEAFNWVYQITTGSGGYSAQWGRSSAPGPGLMVVAIDDVEAGGGGGDEQPIVKRMGGVPGMPGPKFYGGVGGGVW
jgi:hypothetical protein